MNDNPIVEHHILPNGLQVDYIDETHQYFVNGKEVPSITQLLDKKYGSSYDHVNPTILKRASEYGSRIHNELHDLIEKRIADPTATFETESDEVYNYFTRVESLYKIQPLLTERVVALYNCEGNVVACGRFDLLCNVDGACTLADFKTTSSINRQHVTGQLNLYLKAAYQSGYVESDELKLGVIHLSGNTARFVPIPTLSPNFYLGFLNL